MDMLHFQQLHLNDKFFFSKVELIFPVIAILLLPLLFAYFKSFINSFVSPLLEINIRTSSSLKTQDPRGKRQRYEERLMGYLMKPE